MNTISLFLIEVALTLLVCITTVLYLRPFLRRILVDLCGTEDRAQFWTVFSCILLVGPPLLIALTFHPEAKSAEELFFEITHRISGNLSGFLFAMLGIGFIISFFGLVAPRVKGNKMKIAVTGAFSYSGKYITGRLLDRGEELITLTNHPDRPDPFAGKVKAFPLDFSNENELTASLQRSDVLVNTYWIRFDKGGNTQPHAVENTRVLINAAAKAKVRRIVHISITNPSPGSHLPYFWGKAANEKAVIDSGMSYAILRPTVLFGKEDILINNIAWLLRHFPIFCLPGNALYKLSPVYVDDLAVLAVDSVYQSNNYIWDTVGPDEFTFREMVEMIGRTIGVKRAILPIPPRLALLAAQILSLFLKDVMLTSEEVDGLMANLLISKEPPRGKTSLRNWLEVNKSIVGTRYASELARHF